MMNISDSMWLIQLLMLLLDSSTELYPLFTRLLEEILDSLNQLSEQGCRGDSLTIKLIWVTSSVTFNFRNIIINFEFIL